jgi:nucleotide-binding universal stress UspA family protein
MIARNEQPDLAQSFQQRSLRAWLSRRTDNPSSVNAAEPSRMETKQDWRIRTILAPTNFSPASVDAVAQAATLARRHDALLTILHVIDINPPSARTHVGPADELMRQLWAIGKAELRRLTESLEQQQTRTQARIIEGIPAEVIIENSSSFDLLAINEERSGSAWNPFSRHTARRVIEGAACPLLVVHPRTEPENA